ncbi:MAG: hypothetical protein JSW17_03830 [Candidatus Omnitrophota bacterium]|nr:MAG: hypothetical protein JSW17_03830 [Candidatus Omnitrophota bacterium]
MSELNKIFQSLFEEKQKEKEGILKEAQEKKESVLRELEEEAKKHYERWYKKSRDNILRRKQEEIFGTQLNSKQVILEEKEKIWKEALGAVKDYLSKHKEDMPKRELVTKEGVKKIDIDMDEFLKFLKEKYASQTEDFFGL